MCVIVDEIVFLTLVLRHSEMASYGGGVLFCLQAVCCPGGDRCCPDGFQCVVDVPGRYCELKEGNLAGGGLWSQFLLGGRS